MKKIVFVIFMVVVLGVFHVSAQDNTTVIDIGGVKINIPTPNAGFKEVGINQHDLFNTFIPDFNKLLCVYTDTSDYTHLLNGENDNVKLNNYMFIEVSKKFINHDITTEDFNDLKKEVVGLLKKDLSDIIESANEVLQERKDEVGDVNINEPKALGCIYDIKNAYGSLMSINAKTETTKAKLICSLNFIRIKKRLIYIYVYCNFDNINKINWIKDFSESWAKAILDANK